jgi:hypothetical protein
VSQRPTYEAISGQIRAYVSLFPGNYTVFISGVAYQGIQELPGVRQCEKVYDRQKVLFTMWGHRRQRMRPWKQEEEGAGQVGWGVRSSRVMVKHIQVPICTQSANEITV